MDDPLLLAAQPPSVPLLETAWGQPIDPLDRYDADWDWQRRTGMTGFATGRIEDHAGGKNRPVFETEADLDCMRAAADVLCETSPGAIAALKNLTNFVIGTGFVYTAAPRPKKDAPEAMIDAVQEVIDEFLEDNDWCGDRERELFGISRRHGEFLIQITDEDGQAAVRNIASARLKEPRIVPGYCRSTTFGVETLADDLESVLGYWVQWDSLDGQLEFTDAETVEHIKLNVDRGIKRGVSDFFAVDPDLDAARVLLKAMVKGGSVQASIAYIVQHAPGVINSQIQNLITQNATEQKQRTYQTGSRTINRTQLTAGGRLDVANGQEYKGSPLANGEAANAYVTILQAGLRSIGSRWCMPEYMISGDASNANYSSTMVAESPFVRNCEVEQAFYKRKFLKVIWKAIEIAAGAGRLGQDFETVKKMVEIQVDCPRVAARDEKQETERRKILKDAGILSDKTWAGQEGLDYEQEKENIDAQPKPEPLAMLPGQVPGQPSKPGEPVKPGDPKQAAVAAALESVRTTEEARAVLESYP